MRHGASLVQPARRRRLLVVGAVVAAPMTIIAIMLWIAWEPAHSASTGAGAGAGTAAAHFLLALALMLGLAFAGGKMAMLLGQPAVIGELIVGIALGPSLLGSLAGGLSDWLFADAALTMVHGLSGLGLVMFMAGVGMEFAGSANRCRPGDSLVAAASLLVPFAAGTVLAAALAGHYLGPAGSRPAFVLFLGCVFGVTAFPVLAKLLSDCGLSGSRIGQLSMYSAAMGDGAVWVLLLVAGAFAGGGLELARLWPSLAVIAVLVVALTQFGRLSRPARSSQVEPADRRLAPAVIAIAVTAAATAFGGVHEVAGAFLAGILLHQVAARYGRALQDAMVVAKHVLFPLFLVQFGMAVDFTALPMTVDTLLVGAAIVLIGSVAKVAGAGLTARVNGMSWRDSMMVGTLANARGMTELVVLQIGQQLGIISPAMFVMLTSATVLMTVLVAPVITLLKARPAQPALADTVVDQPRLRVGR